MSASKPSRFSMAEVGLVLLVAAAWSALFVGIERATVALVEGGATMRPSGLLALWSIQATMLGSGLLVLAVAEAMRRLGARWLSPNVAAWMGAIVLAGLVAWPGSWMGDKLAAGDWISQQSYARFIGLAVGIAVAIAVAIAARLSWALTPGGPLRRRAIAWTSVLAVGSVAASLVDLVVFPNLHIPFHLFVHGVAGLLAAATALRLAVHLRGQPRHPAWLVLGLLVPLSAAATLINLSPTAKAALLLRSSTAANWIRTIGPPRAEERRELRNALALLDRDTLSQPPEREASSAADKWGIDDRFNILFVTVDTFRADTLPPVRGDGSRHAQPGDTPHLDEWLSGAFRFRRAYAQAAMTHRSLPPTFRSLEAYENPDTIGVPLATAMQNLGRVPVAVVSNFFVEPRFRRIQQLGEGFQQIAVFDKPEMHRQIPLVRETLTDVAGRPFFAWVHFYCMHAPGFDGELLGRPDGPWFERYRRSLKWFDGEFGKLLDFLDEQGLRERTIIVLAADHGEGLGDHRVQTHGPTVFDSEIRTPLAIDVPGTAGAQIDATVGNIDIVPTLYDLLGADADPTHRGRSLVPLMTNPSAFWPHAYYSENKKGTMVAVTVGEQKLVWDLKADTYYRFDLSEDPDENDSLYGEDPRADTRLLLALAHRNPKLFRPELDQAETMTQLEAAWARASEAAPNAAFEFLLRLTALRSSPATQAAAFRLFETTPHDGVRLLLVRHLFARDATAWAERLREHLQSIAGTQRELAFVEGLARQGQGEFAPTFVFGRLAELEAEGSSREWQPWLRLIEPWKKATRKDLEPVLVPLLVDHDDAQFDTRTLSLLLANLASLPATEANAPADERLETRLVALTDHPTVNVQVAALAALGRTAGPAGIEQLEAKLASETADIRVRQAAMVAYVERRNEAAIPLVAKHGQHPFLTVDAVKAMRRIGHPDGLPFLRDIAKNYYNELIRKDAKRAIAAINKRSRRTKKSASKSASQ